jgi:hypothetical protein
MEVLKTRKCQHCNKSLKLIGMARINGSTGYLDWNDRKYHKKCFYILKNEMEIQQLIHRIELEQLKVMMLS